MDEWTERIWPQLIYKAKNDPNYRGLLSRCSQLEEGYIQIMQTLSPPQQKIIESYLSACEEADYRMIQLAYQHGRYHQKSYPHR